VNLRAALQEILGEKFFRDKVTFDKDVIFKKTITGYSPVPGEPSNGTSHIHPQTIVNGVDPVDTSDHTETYSGAPTGSKLMYAYGEIVAATAGRQLLIKDSAGTTVYGRIFNPTTAIEGSGSFLVPLDSNKQFKWSVSNADVSVVNIIGLIYWC
jgi:hypothetical protein